MFAAPVGDRARRYDQLVVTKFGTWVRDGFPAPVSRLQLAEAEVRYAAVPSVNLARGAAVIADTWEARFLADGTLTTEQSPRGYTSYERGEPILGELIWLPLDLGSVRHFDQVVLYPRTDVTMEFGGTAGFPVDYANRTGNIPKVRSPGCAGRSGCGGGGCAR